MDLLLLVEWEAVQLVQQAHGVDLGAVLGAALGAVLGAALDAALGAALDAALGTPFVPPHTGSGSPPQ